MCEPLGDDAHQLGHRGQVPVELAHLDVPEVGRQHRDLAVDVDALGVPGLDAADHHAVAQVVHAWRAGAPGRGPAQPAAQQPEGVVGRVVADPVAAVGAEERRIRARRPEAPGPVLGVAAQRVQRAGMQRHHPGAAAFAGADGQHTLGQVDVARRSGPALR